MWEGNTMLDMCTFSNTVYTRKIISIRTALIFLSLFIRYLLQYFLHFKKFFHLCTTVARPSIIYKSIVFRKIALGILQSIRCLSLLSKFIVATLQIILNLSLFVLKTDKFCFVRGCVILIYEIIII